MTFACLGPQRAAGACGNPGPVWVSAPPSAGLVNRTSAEDGRAGRKTCARGITAEVLRLRKKLEPAMQCLVEVSANQINLFLFDFNDQVY